MKKNLLNSVCVRFRSTPMQLFFLMMHLMIRRSILLKLLPQNAELRKIIQKKEWYRDEPGDRNRLLEAGREIGGTHFIVLDADEMFTANCLENNFLKNTILRLEPGDVLWMIWICLWRSIDQYRFDKSVWTWNYKPFILYFVIIRKRFILQILFIHQEFPLISQAMLSRYKDISME